MNSTDQIKQLQNNIDRNKEFVRTGEALERLMKNPDFKKVIKEGYFEQEAIRLVHLKSDPSQQTPDRQASIISQMDSIGTLRSYFDVVFHNANSAISSIANDEDTILEIGKEGE